MRPEAEKRHWLARWSWRASATAVRVTASHRMTRLSYPAVTTRSPWASMPLIGEECLITRVPLGSLEHGRDRARSVSGRDEAPRRKARWDPT